MNAPVITAEKVRAAVQDLADARPDHRVEHVYERGMASVLYVHQGEPCCILGQALASLDVIDASLERQWQTNRLGISYLLDYLLIDGTDEDIDWLRWAQWYQDRGDCWGSAVSKADECIARDIPWSLRGEVA